MHCGHPCSTSSVYCDKSGRGSSNRTCRIFGCLGNHVEGTILPSSTVLTPSSDNSCFCSQSRSVYARPKFITHHGTKSPLGRLGQSSVTKALVQFKICRGCTKCCLHLSWLVVSTSWTGHDTGPHAPSAVQFRAIQVIVSVVLLMNIWLLAGRCTAFRSYGWAANGKERRFSKLDGTQRTAATHMGM